MLNPLRRTKTGAGLQNKESFMNTTFIRHCGMGLAAGLIFFLGCARPSAQTEPQKAAITAPGQPLPGTPNAEAEVPGPESTNAPAIVERIPPGVKPENVSLSPGLAEIVKLAQAGVGEEVILAYVEKYSGPFEVGADQILYLNDLGVSSTVITSMLKHDGSAIADAATATNAPPPTQAASAVTQTQVTTVAPPPTSTEVAYFYDTLAPYGSWVYLSGYGWCWQPTVAVSVSTWRPYCDRGRWYWSDGGWYWYSDYSWGWAAFHYGRWYQHPGCGWVWAPGLTWAPSWVSWRYYDGYCGWAPLPPEAHFVHGAGFRYYGRHVSVGFDFGLRDFHYTFVHINNFCDYAPYRYTVPHARVRNFYHNTTVVNNYIVGDHNTVINHGIGRDTIARASTTRLREVSIRETPVRDMTRVHGDRLEKQGNQLVVHRPQLPSTPPAVRTHFANRSAASGQTTVASRTAAGGSVNNGTSINGSRGHSDTSSRSGNAGRVEPTRPQQNETHEPARNVTPSRGNAGHEERGASRNATPATPSSPVPQSRPQTQSTRTQPRSEQPLFGSGTASKAPATETQPARGHGQENRPSGRSTETGTAPAAPVAPAPITRGRSDTTPPAHVPRGQAAPSASPQGARVYPQTPAPQSAPERSPRVEAPRSGHSVMPPRQYEQLPRSQQSPRSSAPGYQNQSTPPPSRGGIERSAPSQSMGVERGRSSQSPGAARGGGQGEGGHGRGDRGR
jgi:hypothetical protein